MFRTLAALIALLTAFELATEKVAAQSVTLTFYLNGVECGACSELIGQAVRQVPKVSDYAPYEFGIVNITFDARAVTPHRIAQAVAEAFAAHGKPYEATLHIRVPDYAKADNATRVDAVFAKQSEAVKFELIDRTKGEFVLHFVPLKAEAKPTMPEWNLGVLTEAIQAPVPAGLGLVFQLVQIGQEK